MCNSGFVCVLCHLHFFVTMNILLTLPLECWEVKYVSCNTFYFPKYKEASKQNLLYSAITLILKLNVNSIFLDRNRNVRYKFW